VVDKTFKTFLLDAEVIMLQSWAACQCDIQSPLSTCHIHLIILIVTVCISVLRETCSRHWWLGGVVVRVSDINCNQQVPSSIPGHALPGQYLDG